MSGSIHPLTTAASSCKMKWVKLDKYFVHFYTPPSSGILAGAPFLIIHLPPRHLFRILPKSLRGNEREREGSREKEGGPPCQRVMRNPLQANGIQRQRLANFHSNYCVINAWKGELLSSAVIAHFTWLNSQFFAKTITCRFGSPVTESFCCTDYSYCLRWMVWRCVVRRLLPLTKTLTYQTGSRREKQ